MRSWVGGLCAAALVMGLSGCSEEAAPVEPTSSATSAPATVKAPQAPPSARKFSPAGAASFVAHFVAVIDHASKTGDVETLRRLSDPNCGGCSDYIDFYEDVYAKGGWLRDRNWTSGETDVWFSKQPDAEMRAQTTFRVTAGEVKTDEASEASPAPASTEKVTLGLRYLDGAWIVTQLVPGDAG